MGSVTEHSGYGTLYRGHEAIVDVRFKETRRTSAKSTSSTYEIVPAYGVIGMNLGILTLRPARGEAFQIVLRRTDGKKYDADPAA